jgi:AcrR family transcriptional regulator
METRDLILDVSLSLFAQSGYAATSVRDISKLVGVKDSSLYFHFASKQAIMDSLKERFVSTSAAAVGFIRQGIGSLNGMSADIFMSVTEGYMRSYFLEPFINRFIRVLLHEQSGSAELRELYLQWCIRKPVEFQAEFMEKLQDLRFLKRSDARHTAEAYYSPIFLYFHRYLADSEGFETQKERFMESVLKHAELFLKEYGV